MLGTGRYRMATLVAALALVLALAAFVCLAFWPNSYRGESISSGGVVEHTSHSLVEENGPGVLWIIAVPAFLALGALATSLWHAWPARWLMFALASLALAFSLIGIASFGGLALPAALLLIAAAFLHPAHP